MGRHHSEELEDYEEGGRLEFEGSCKESLPRLTSTDPKQMLGGQALARTRSEAANLVAMTTNTVVVAVAATRTRRTARTVPETNSL